MCQIHGITEVTHTMVFSMCSSETHKQRAARVPSGCKSSGELSLCSSLLMILYLPSTSVLLCSVLFQLSLLLPNSPSARMLPCVLQVRHLQCSYVLLLVRCFRSRYPPSSIEPSPHVPSSAFDRFLLSMSVFHTRTVCCM